MKIDYYLAIGANATHREIATALACGQRYFVASVGTRCAALLQREANVRVVLDSGAWPPNHSDRPSREAWWQHLRTWQRAEDDFGNLDYALAYDTIGNDEQMRRDERWAMGKLWHSERTQPTPVVPVLAFPNDPRRLILAFKYDSYAVRPDVIDGSLGRPCVALGNLVPQRSSLEAIAWVQSVAEVLNDLIDDGIDPDLLGVHVLGSTRRAYLDPLAALVPTSCDTSTPLRMAGHGRLPPQPERFGLDPTQPTTRLQRLAAWINHECLALGAERQRCEAITTYQHPRFDDQAPVRVPRLARGRGLRVYLGLIIPLVLGQLLQNILS